MLLLSDFYSVLIMCMCVYVWVWAPGCRRLRRPEAHDTSGAVATGGCELPSLASRTGTLGH